MALHTIGTKAATQLACLPAWSQTLAPADLGAINNAISLDSHFAGAANVTATATTAGSTTLTVVAARAGSPPVSQIQIGDRVVGSVADIAPGTTVTAITGGGTTLTLSAAAGSTGAAKSVAFVHQRGHGGLGSEGLLAIPGRGVLRLQPGDVVAVDSLGFPYLIPATSVSYLGSDWTFT